MIRTGQRTEVGRRQLSLAVVEVGAVVVLFLQVRKIVGLGGPAPKPLQLFHITETDGELIVDTNPLNVIDRPSSRWDPAVIEIADGAG